MLVLSNPRGASLGYPSAELDLTANAGPTSSGQAPTAPATPSAPEPGPTVVAVAPQKGRRGFTSLLITFDQARSPSTAQNPANYQVTLPSRGLHALHRHRSAIRPGRSLGITAVAYDPATRQVILSLHKKFHQGQAIQLQIKGTSGGVTATQGTPLGSPDKLHGGQDYSITLDLGMRRP